MSEWEREHIVAAFRFALGKCAHTHVREAVVEQLNRIDHALATQVAEGIGVKPPATQA
jgi:catalase